MNKEKIKKGAVDMCEKHGLGWNEATYLIDDLFFYLDSKGVVIKVERKLPECMVGACMSASDKVYKQAVWDYAQASMLEAGYEAVESLVEGK